MALTQTADGYEVAWTLGELIRKARKTADLEQQQLADAVGVSRGLVGHWENDRGREPSYRQLVAIANATGFPLEVLLSTIGYKSSIAGEPPDLTLIDGTSKSKRNGYTQSPLVASVP